MVPGFAGKLLFVDLSARRVTPEPLPSDLALQFLGGAGLGARVLYERQSGGVDPLGPQNTLGLMTGALVATGAPYAVRTTAVGKSPLTGTWGDASCGGSFAHHLKRAGFDAVFFTGVADRPVYLWVHDGRAELRDANHLWGLDTVQATDAIHAELGDRQAGVLAIGPSGEQQSLIACLIVDKGNAAGRSGLGALMGSKRLKAVVAHGTQTVPVADPERLHELTREAVKMMSSRPSSLSKYGTCAGTAAAIFSGDCPVRNWAGVGDQLLPHAEQISDENVIKYEYRKLTCPGCSIACNGLMRVTSGPYAVEGVQKPEYETLGAFGGMTVVDNVEAIIACNDLCNRYGLDTISAGAAVAFAMECFEHGLLTARDTDGLELRWGDHGAMVALTERIARREGLGALLADGVARAAAALGPAAEPFAVHVHGQELPMHDPRLAQAQGRPLRLGLVYQLDATPGRHTASLDFRGAAQKATGLCGMGSGAYREEKLGQFLQAVTGVEWPTPAILAVGERFLCQRQAFNVREGLRPADFRLPARARGEPPLSAGPLRGITLDMDRAVAEHYRALGWDPRLGLPGRERLASLGGLEQILADLPAAA